MSEKFNITPEKKSISVQEMNKFKNFNLLIGIHAKVLTKKSQHTMIKGLLSLIALASLLYFLMPILPESITKEKRPIDQNKFPLVINKDEIKNEVALKISNDTFETNKKSTNEKKKKNIKKIAKKKVTIETKKQTEKAAIIDIDSTKALIDYKYVEAKPVNGISDLYQYFERELKYPISELKDSIEGTVLISFYINNKNGIDRIEVLKSLSIELDKEAVRVIENMPAWQSATVNGKAIESKMSIPLSFHIDKVLKNSKE